MVILVCFLMLNKQQLWKERIYLVSTFKSQSTKKVRSGSLEDSCLVAYSWLIFSYLFNAASHTLPRVGNTRSGPGPLTSKNDKGNAPQAGLM